MVRVILPYSDSVTDQSADMKALVNKKDVNALFTQMSAYECCFRLRIFNLHCSKLYQGSLRQATDLTQLIIGHHDGQLGTSLSDF